ncbi:MAG: hypothetical protein KAI17_01560 [Thiotrichaceae bacterium]|nr:hypothetical protein [Thiotrichaceae bacterium]
MTRLLISLAISILITGCQSLSEPVDFSHPKSKPPVGTVVQLNETLIFEQGTSRTYIQNGKAKSFKEVDDRAPWCQFSRYEPRAALKTERSAVPDRFTITSSSQRMEMVSAKPFPILAANVIIPSMLDNDGQNAQTLATIMKIKSDQQPEIAEFKCAVFNDPYMENFVSVNQIIDTLGNVVTLKFQ